MGEEKIQLETLQTNQQTFREDIVGIYDIG